MAAEADDSTTTVLLQYYATSRWKASCTDENSDLSIIAALCASSKRRDRSSQQEVLVRATPLVPGIWHMASAGRGLLQIRRMLMSWTHGPCTNFLTALLGALKSAMCRWQERAFSFSNRV